jgi:transcriptional regulator with XRE-family HTH domain
MIKGFKNVKEMIKGLSEDDKFKENALNEIENKTIAKFLFTLRCKHNLTQKQLADKIGCTQSRISKIEGAYNNEITIKDLSDYGEALNLQLEIGYRNKDMKIVDLIKYHAFKIKGYLEKLVDITGEDETLAKGVLGFHFETLWNVAGFILKNIPNLHQKSLGPAKEPIHLSPPLEDSMLTEVKQD